MQTVLVLVGLPGSGKTSVAEQLLAASDNTWTWINQDTLGHRPACESECWRALQEGRDVVIDRCNHTRRQRATWVQQAQEMQRRGRSLQLLCLALELPPGECKRRAAARTAHATLSPEEAPAVIDRFLAEYEAPTKAEGFHLVLRATSPAEVHALLHAHLLPLHGQQQHWQQQQQHWRQQPAAAWQGPGPHLAQQQWGASWGHQASAGSGLAAAPSAGPDAAEWRQPLFPPQQQQQQRQPHQQQLLQAGSTGWASDYATAATPLPPGPPGQPQGRGGGGDPGQGASRSHGAPAAQEPGGSWGSGAERRAQSPQRWRPRASPPPLEQRQWQQASSNIVPFGKGPGAAAVTEPGSPRWGGQGRASYLDEGDDPRPILLFDMNGTLTSHTHRRRSTGRNRPRPGIHHLRRLASKFRVGVFTSASKKTVEVAVAMLEREAGEGPGPVFDPALILHRVHTQPVDQSHVVAGGKPWDTVKPLHRYFGKLHRVILVDDDAYKALPSEEGNMLLVPCWHEDPQDTMVQHIVEVLLGTFGPLDVQQDVRKHTAAASEALHSIARRLEEERQRQAAAAGEAQEEEQQQPAGEDGAGDRAANGVADGAAKALAQGAVGANPEEIELGDEASDS